MKKILLLFPFCIMAAISFAQNETFDIISYATPAFWKKTATNNIVTYSITNEKTKTWCQIAIVKSTISKGNIEQDFESEWQELAVKNYQPTDAPQLNDVVEADGWKIKTGVAKFKFSNADAIAMLTTISGFDRCASIIATTNTQDYIKDIETFLASVSLKKPAIPEQNNNGLNSQTTGSLTNYVWKSYQNRKDGMGNNAGYSTNSYQFTSNGTYKFSNTTFQYFTPKYYLVNEEGTYQIKGNKITLNPVKSKFEVRQREKTDPVLKSGNISLEAVEYSFEYTTVYDRLRLVLAPDNKNETKRDGVFNYYANGEQTKSYLYDAEEAISTQNNINQTELSTIQSKPSFAFTTTNFDDGWTSNVKEDWVEVTKANLKVLIHYSNKAADAHNFVLLDGLKTAWDVLVAPRYSSASNMEFKPLTGWQSIEFAEADMVETATGKLFHVVLFKMNYSNGSGKYLEFISSNKKSFEQEFGAYHATTYGWEKMESMANYNKFAVAATDLSGKWSNDFSGMTQYVNAYTGADAGANTHASNQNFEFGAGNTYKWDLGVASGFVGNIKFQSVNSSGKFSVPNNWQIYFSDMEGKPKTYNSYFTCIKNARVLWIGETGFGKKE